MLDRNQVIAYIGQTAPQYGVDPAAMLAVANQEGLNTAPGSIWTVQGESGPSFGPPSWFSGGAGAPFIQQQGSASAASAWSWSVAGLNTWIQQVAQVASGLTGNSAINAIVTRFERPAAKNVPGEIQRAQAQYSNFQQQLNNIGGTADIQPQVSTDTGVQPTTDTTAQAQPSASGTPSGMNLSFTDSLGHITTQFLLILVGIALLVGGIYLLGSRR